MVELVNRFKNGINIHVIDPQSLRGFFKTLRYRVRKYPAFIIDNQELIIGWDNAALELALEGRLSKKYGNKISEGEFRS